MPKKSDSLYRNNCKKIPTLTVNLFWNLRLLHAVVTQQALDDTSVFCVNFVQGEDCCFHSVLPSLEEKSLAFPSSFYQRPFNSWCSLWTHFYESVSLKNFSDAALKPYLILPSHSFFREHFALVSTDFFFFFWLVKISLNSNPVSSVLPLLPKQFLEQLF